MYALGLAATPSPYGLVMRLRGIYGNIGGRELARIGINWQKFLSILSNHTQELIDWAIRNTLAWNDLVRILVNDLSPGTEVTTTGRKGGILDYLG